MAKHSKTIPPQLTYGFLGVVGVITLVLGFSNLGRVINNPAARVVQERQNVFERVQSANTAAEQQLRTQDTDNDGLLDFDELNLYGTSPYLADSDSDGFGDKQEIESGNDPNCPAGISCRSVPASENQAALNNEGSVSLDSFANILNLEPQAAAPTVDLTNLNANQIRELILQSGEMTAQQLSQIDDAAIMQVYEQMLAEGAITSEPAQENINLNNLSAGEIRELILQSGQMTEAQLNEIDDAIIMQLYEEMIAEAGGSL